MPVIACPHCSTRLEAPESVLGREVVCGRCQRNFMAVAAATIPAPQQPAAGEVEPSPAEGFGQADVNPYDAAAAGTGGNEPPPTPPPPAPSPFGAAPMAGVGPGMQGPISGNATASMVLGISSIVVSVLGTCCCGPVGVLSVAAGIVAVILARKVDDELASGRTGPASESRAKAGKICGIIGIVLGGLALVLLVLGLLLNIGMAGRQMFPFKP